MRQCIGCRKRASKETLLRFVKTLPGTVVMNNAAKEPGRGFYLCPRVECLNMAFLNKRARAEYFRKRENVDEVLREVQDSILKMIEIKIRTCEKMGYLYGIPADEKLIREDDLVLINHDNPPEEKVTMYTTASNRGLKAFVFPFTFKEGSKALLVRYDYPMISMLEADLQKYGMLSSKGLAV